MIEDLFEVFDVNTGEIFATNMKEYVAVELIGALFNKFYNECCLSIGIRKTKETIGKLFKENEND